MSPPGGTTETLSTISDLEGGGNAIGATCAGSMASNSVSRCQPWRAATKPRQFAIAVIHRRECARAQDRAGDHDAGGRLLEDHEIGADRQHARLRASCAERATAIRSRRPRRWRAVDSPGSCCWPRSSERRTRPVIPIAVSTSALRRLVSASDVAGRRRGRSRRASADGSSSRSAA